jgi:tetratricopeptide (TPR) repeat protein
VRHLTAALGIRPGSVSTHVVLSIALRASRELEGAEAECREAVRLRPDDSVARSCLGDTLRWQGKHDEAAREIHEAIRLKPDYAGARSSLAVLLRDQLKFDESIAEFREAIRLRPDFFSYYLDYAQALRRKGEYAEALAVVRKAQAMSPRSLVDYFHPPDWFAKIETLASLAGRLPAILKGAARPKNIAERLDVAQMCYDDKSYAAALRFWSEALEEDPKLGDNRRAQHRYNAACCALLIESGRGKDATPLDNAARTDLRRRAFAWLEAELGAWSTLLETGSPRDRSTVVTTIRWWPRDPDLATVRDADALAKLPEAERKDWQAFWKEYDALMCKGGETKPR